MCGRSQLHVILTQLAIQVVALYSERGLSGLIQQKHRVRQCCTGFEGT